MPRTCRLFLRLSSVWGLLVITLCLAGVFISYNASEPMYNFIERVLTNYGIVDGSGNSSFFETTGVLRTFRMILIIYMALILVPSILCLNVLRNKGPIRYKSIIVTGAISLNLFAVMAGIHLLKYVKNQSENEND